MTGTGMDEEKRTRTSTGMGAGMKTRTSAGTGTRMEKRVEAIERLKTYEVVVEVGRKTREGERRQQRVSSNPSRKTRRPSETVASCGGPESSNGRRGSASGRAEELQKSYRRDVENEELRCREKKCRKESIGSVDVDPEDLDDRKEVGKEA